jgi:hypothetical protein
LAHKHSQVRNEFISLLYRTFNSVTVRVVAGVYKGSLTIVTLTSLQLNMEQIESPFFHAVPCSSMLFSCTAWNCMKQHGTAWNCMKQHGTAWNCMKQHEKHDSNIFMLHGTAWNCMELHENTNISYREDFHVARMPTLTGARFKRCKSSLASLKITYDLLTV